MPLHTRLTRGWNDPAPSAAPALRAVFAAGAVALALILVVLNLAQ